MPVWHTIVADRMMNTFDTPTHALLRRGIPHTPMVENTERGMESTGKPP